MNENMPQEEEEKVSDFCPAYRASLIGGIVCAATGILTMAIAGGQVKTPIAVAFGLVAIGVACLGFHSGISHLYDKHNDFENPIEEEKYRVTPERLENLRIDPAAPPRRGNPDRLNGS